VDGELYSLLKSHGWWLKPKDAKNLKYSLFFKENFSWPIIGQLDFLKFQVMKYLQLNGYKDFKDL